MLLVAAGEREAHGTEISLHVNLGVPVAAVEYIAGADSVLVIAHAPHNDPGWWDGFPAKLRQVNVPGLPVVVLADANAHVGSVRSGSVGDVGSGQESLAGSAFHRALFDLDLAVPARSMGPLHMSQHDMLLAP